jgi:alkylated DNA nucleotide flippase Atl1
MTDRTVRNTGYTRWDESVFQKAHEIPRGHVSTYGDIALALDAKGYARQVGRSLSMLTPERAAYPKGVPWWRVVNGSGSISFRPKDVQVKGGRKKTSSAKDEGKTKNSTQANLKTEGTKSDCIKEGDKEDAKTKTTDAVSDGPSSHQKAKGWDTSDECASVQQSLLLDEGVYFTKGGKIKNFDELRWKFL